MSYPPSIPLYAAWVYVGKWLPFLRVMRYSLSGTIINCVDGYWWWCCIRLIEFLLPVRALFTGLGHWPCPSLLFMNSAACGFPHHGKLTRQPLAFRASPLFLGSGGGMRRCETQRPHLSMSLSQASWKHTCGFGWCGISTLLLWGCVVSPRSRVCIQIAPVLVSLSPEGLALRGSYLVPHELA